MKKFIAVIMCVLFFVGMLPLSASAYESYGVFQYRITGLGVEIVYCDSDATGHITVPSEIDGRRVYSIAMYAFKRCDKITSVTLPSLTYVGASNFRGDSLTDVYCVDRSEPGGWDDRWVSDNVTVHWGCKAPCYGVHSWSNSCDQSCNVCGETRTINHTPGNSATCTEDQICTVCRITITPAHHTPGSAATCTNDQVCLLCGDVLEKAGHKLGGWSVALEPTFDTEGRREQSCIACNEVINTEIIPAYLLGDVNKNGEIEKYDYIAVKRAVMGTLELDETQQKAADVNSKDGVEKYDYILIKRHVMGTFTIG